MITEFNSAERQQHGDTEPGATAAMPHTSGFQLGWKEALVRIGTIIALVLSAWLFFYSARNDPELARPDMGAWEAGFRRAAWWGGAILFSGTATFMTVQLLATAFSGRRALGFIPWLTIPASSLTARGARR